MVVERISVFMSRYFLGAIQAPDNEWKTRYYESHSLYVVHSSPPPCQNFQSLGDLFLGRTHSMFFIQPVKTISLQ